MKNYQHLFFDLDHTLWDFETNSRLTMEDVFTELGVSAKINAPFEDFFTQYSHHNKLLWERYQKGFIGVEELKWKRMWRTLLDFKIGDENLSKEMSKKFLEILPTKKKVFPHTQEILKYLKEKNYELHLITNGFEKTQWSKLKHSDIDHYFTHVVTSENSNSMKPSREIFEYALNLAGAKTTHSIMIGDNLEADIRGAMNAGLDTVFVNHIEEEANIASTYEVRNLIELENIF